MVSVRRVLLVTTVTALAGCPDRDISEVNTVQDRVEIKDIPSTINRNLDLLFLVDKSPTMRDEQMSLATNFPRFVDVLQTIDGGLPDLHLGVVTQDIGAGGYNVGMTCSGGGDAGILQATASPYSPPGCPVPTGNYISDIGDGSGGRIRNYPPDQLAETFGCIAQVGPEGCGFEQHLAALDLALGGTVPANAGFVRDGAFLGIVIISDEDDCSASNPAALFDPSSGGGPLGPVSDFRCAEYGWTCDDGPVARAPGQYDECEPMQDSPYLHHPDHYVDRLIALKGDPRLLIVANIIGESTPIRVAAKDGSTDMELKPSCINGDQNAEPMPRLTYFAQQFPNRSTQISICEPDLGDSLDQVGALLAAVLGTPCFQTDIRQDDLSPDPGLQLDCTVVEKLTAGTGNVIPRCAMSDETTVAPTSASPCYYIFHDAANCAPYPTQLAIAMHPADRVPPPGSTLHVECVSH